MSHVRKGQLTASREWRKHLRFWKKFFWRAERREAKRQITEETRARPRAGLLISAKPYSQIRHGWFGPHPVMAGLVPAIHVLLLRADQMRLS
jgi:hypothetical protein